MIDTTFLEDLSSSAPTPGGGGASAYAGALAASLGAMVANLSIGKRKFAYIEDELIFIRELMEKYRTQLVELVDKDAVAFSALAETWKMPKGTSAELEIRNAATQAALIDACEVPLAIMRVCTKVVEMSGLLARRGSKLVVTDAGASAVLAQAAVKAAGLNVYINTALMDDKKQAKMYEAEADELVAAFEQEAEDIYQYVKGVVQK